MEKGADARILPKAQARLKILENLLILFLISYNPSL